MCILMSPEIETLGELPKAAQADVLRLKQMYCDKQIRRRDVGKACTRIAKRYQPKADGLIPWFDKNYTKPNKIVGCEIFRFKAHNA